MRAGGAAAAANRRTPVRVFALFVVVAALWPTAAAAGQPRSQIGSWELLADSLPQTPIHAALLRTGKVWLASGSALDPAKFAAGTFPSYVWDPVNELLTSVDTPWDVFCSGHSFLADGRLLVAGGTAAYPATGTGRDFAGSRRAFAFDPLTQRYTALANMADGRWYPTLVTLGNGRIYAVTGNRATGMTPNTVPELYYPAINRWRTRPNMPAWPTYPGLVLAESGRLLFSGANVDQTTNAAPALLDVDTSALTAVPGLSAPAARDHSATVLLPPAQRQRVAIIGGGTPSAAATDHVDIVDLKRNHPAFQAAASLHWPRAHGTAVILPDRTVLMTGGGQRVEDDPLFNAESYDPVTNTWTVLAAATVERLYHSFALLLPDGRVLVGGSQPDGGTGPAETRLEIFSPPYLFRGTRPTITAAPESFGYGSNPRIGTTGTAPIEWVSLIRPSAVTHTTDTEQRLVNVPFRRLGSGRLELTVTGKRNIAPPGWYMLFVTDSTGVPSVARWVHLS